MAPKSIRGDLGLGVWVLGTVKESIVLSEGEHAESALSGDSTWKPWQTWLWLLNLLPLLHMIIILGP